MKVKELIELGLDTAIVGPPASGKTTMAKSFVSTHMVVPTDQFIGMPGAIWTVIKNLSSLPSQKPLCIEGVACYELLAEGLWSPELVIELTATPQRIETVYATQRELHKLDGVLKYMVKQEELWAEFVMKYGDQTRIETINPLLEEES